jgi:hypothetical protein
MAIPRSRGTATAPQAILDVKDRRERRDRSKDSAAVIAGSRPRRRTLHRRGRSPERHDDMCDATASVVVPGFA